VVVIPEVPEADSSRRVASRYASHFPHGKLGMSPQTNSGVILEEAVLLSVTIAEERGLRSLPLLIRV
jgi:hypothetical protein